MKKETNTIVMTKKKIFTVLFLAIALVFTGVALDLNGSGVDHAYARGRSSKPSHSPSKSSSKSSSKSVPKGGEKRLNSYGKASLDGGCKKVGKYCVTFSKSGCGNFYIKGYHFGGSKECSILGLKCGGGGKKNPPSNNPGNGPAPTYNPQPKGSTPPGQKWCAKLGKYISVTDTTTACTIPNPAYVPPAVNDAIPAASNPVKLRSLSGTPPLGNNGYSCKIVWADAFESYDNETHCTFSATTGVVGLPIHFDPASSTAPTEFISPSLTHDTVFKMACTQGTDATVVDSKEAVCRINLGQVEI